MGMQSNHRADRRGRDSGETHLRGAKRNGGPSALPARDGSASSILVGTNTGTRTSTKNSKDKGEDAKDDKDKRNGPPDVVWVDDGKSVDQSFRTFYHEGTPPPPELDETSSTAHIKPLEYYDYKYDHVAPPAPIPNATVCGFTRRVFWFVLAVATLLVTIGIGVGVGVGVGLKRRSNAQTSTATTTQPTSTSPSPETSSTASALLACPTANNTKYQVPHSDETFLRICGIDYTGTGQAVDLASVWTANMEDCMINCAEYPGCTGCGWGVIPGDSGSDHRCWLKSSLGDSHQARPGWDFAILQ